MQCLNISVYIFLANFENRNYVRNYFPIAFTIMSSKLQENMINSMPSLYLYDAWLQRYNFSKFDETGVPNYRDINKDSPNVSRGVLAR